MLLVAAATGLELSAAIGVQAAGQGEVFAATAHGRPVLALVTGIGVVNAAFALGWALGRGQQKVSGVLCLGVAGSFGLDAQPLGSAWLVERETWPEYGLLFSGQCAADARGLGFSLDGRNEADPEAVFDTIAWDAPAEAARMGLDAGSFGCAASLTVSGVSADQQRARALHERFGAGLENMALLENMEGFALAYGARQAGLPFAELRTVSNAVGARPPKDWDLPGALAALGRAAKKLLAPAGGPASTPNLRT